VGNSGEKGGFIDAQEAIAGADRQYTNGASFHLIDPIDLLHFQLPHSEAVRTAADAAVSALLFTHQAYTLASHVSPRTNCNQRNPYGPSLKREREASITGNAVSFNKSTGVVPRKCARSSTTDWAEPDMLWTTSTVSPSYSRRYAMICWFVEGRRAREPRPNTR
jgi:hypothetical protein